MKLTDQLQKNLLKKWNEFCELRAEIAKECTFPHCNCNLENNGRHICPRKNEETRRVHAGPTVALPAIQIPTLHPEGDVLSDVQA